MARDAADASAAVTGLAIIERPVDGIPMPEGEAASAALATDRLRFSQIAPTHFVDKILPKPPFGAPGGASIRGMTPHVAHWQCNA
jgi:hypothetical protein